MKGVPGIINQNVITLKEYTQAENITVITLKVKWVNKRWPNGVALITSLIHFLPAVVMHLQY